MRQSLASSTQARSSWPRILLELALEPLEQGEGIGGGAGKPGDHAAIAQPADLLALRLDDGLAEATWPSPAITTWPPLRTARMVVPCHCCPFSVGIVPGSRIKRARAGAEEHRTHVCGSARPVKASDGLRGLAPFAKGGAATNTMRKPSLAGRRPYSRWRRRTER